jgi:hypothetical protein
MKRQYMLNWLWVLASHWWSLVHFRKKPITFCSGMMCFDSVAASYKISSGPEPLFECIFSLFLNMAELCRNVLHLSWLPYNCDFLDC